MVIEPRGTSWTLISGHTGKPPTKHSSKHGKSTLETAETLSSSIESTSDEAPAKKRYRQTTVEDVEDEVITIEDSSLDGSGSDGEEVVDLEDELGETSL